MEEALQPIVLITEPDRYNPTALSVYESVAKVILWKGEMPIPTETLQDAEVLVVRLGMKWTKEIMMQMPKLQCIVTPTTGLDHIDTAFASERNIQIISLKGESSFLETIPSTAEFTWLLIMACLKNFVAAVDHVRHSGWNRNLFVGHNLAGKKIGIIGYGRVGRQVAKYAGAFGMHVMVFDKHQTVSDDSVTIANSVYELLENNDIITIHIPAEGNYLFLSAEKLSAVKHRAILINTSRGSVWDELFVAQLIRNEKLSAVATDVLADEYDEAQRADNPLQVLSPSYPNVIVTPHIAGATIDSMHATELQPINFMNG